MGKKVSTSKSNFISKFQIKQLSPRKIPCTPEAYWIDVPDYFVTKNEEVNNDRYYRNISLSYAKQPDSDPGPYNEDEIDRKFRDDCCQGFLCSKR